MQILFCFSSEAVKSPNPGCILLSAHSATVDAVEVLDCFICFTAAVVDGLPAETNCPTGTRKVSRVVSQIFGTVGMLSQAACGHSVGTAP